MNPSGTSTSAAISPTPVLAQVQPAAVTAAPRPSPWLLGLKLDLLLFIATPVLVLPLALGVQKLYGSAVVGALAGLGALGHHMPGMMRAYGDRELFSRFKVRFVVAPLFLLAACVTCAVLDPKMGGLVMLTYMWGVWHAFMQIHGFLRIYDGRVKSFARVTALLDQWMCITWFVGGALSSDWWVHLIVSAFYVGGGPMLQLGYLDTIRMVWFGLMGLVTAAYFVNLVVCARAGRPQSPVKLLLLATSIPFWWYANAVVENPLVGVLLFEFFHDVQYLSIVWMFNRRRVANDAQIGSFTAYLFRNRGALIGLYVLLVMAYG